MVASPRVRKLIYEVAKKDQAKFLELLYASKTFEFL